ncbi:MAG: IS110 family transposase [Chloroflexi bacterium]|nr:IS110 family transposase [Chloroflexota bacterium]
MYRELQPLRDALSQQLKADLFPAVAGVDPNKLLHTYLHRLTMFIGIDVADQTFTALAVDANDEVLGSLPNCPNNPKGFRTFMAWAEALRDQHGLRIIATACETAGIFYWALWDFLAQQPGLARVLYNPRTTEHMGEVLSKKVRNELVDALLLAEQLRLGSTPEVLLQEDADLLAARYYSRAARDLAQQINRKKNQLRTLLRAYSPSLTQTFPGCKLHHPAVYALLQEYIFPEEFVQAGAEAIAVTLMAHCRTAFGLAEAQQLVEAARQALPRPIHRQVIRCLVQHHLEDITTFRQRQQLYLQAGYRLIQNRPETKLLRGSVGAGISNTLALVTEVGDVSRFPAGKYVASFLGLTTSKHISGTTLFQSKHITKQGTPNGRYAAVNLAFHLSQRVPRYQAMYQRIVARKPPHKGHRLALVAIARDFVTHVLYDMWRYQRPFFKEVEEYHQYRQKHPRMEDHAMPLT